MYIKAAIKGLLIPAAPMDKSGRNTVTSCIKYLEMTSVCIVFVILFLITAVCRRHRDVQICSFTAIKFNCNMTVKQNNLSS